MSNSLSGIKVHFAETMSGYAAAGASTFADGFARGQQHDQRLTLQVSVDVLDLATFLESGEHAAELSGHVEGNLVGGRAQVEWGRFNLLPATADRDRKVMSYRVYCRNSAGEEFTFAGEKQVQCNSGLDLWSDTTTLYVNLFAGRVPAADAARAQILACGILHLGVGDFARVLRSMRATQPNGENSLIGLARFGEFFAGSLWQVYGPSLPPAPNQAERIYPRFTTEGVRDARISQHAFSTADGLGLELTRFTRGESKDVVLLVHGLTTSSDMFIMPEHYNLVQYLLDNGFSDVWALDYRGSNRFPYNLQRSPANLDDIALFDHPAALATLRQLIGPERRIHVIGHCVGSLTFAMSLFGGMVSGIRSAILNSVALTPRVPAWSRVKLTVGPFASDWLLGIEYFNPQWRRQPGWSPGKLLAMGVDLVHQECDSPECHMLSFMWGAGKPALFRHENMHPHTHDRLGDLFGGVSVNYYRHVLKMVRANNTAVKYCDTPRYAALPDNYMQRVASVTTPILLIQGQENRVFADSNIVCHQRLQEQVPGRHQLHVFPDYGHQDIYMGKNVAVDIFPRLLQWLREHCQ